MKANVNRVLPVASRPCFLFFDFCYASKYSILVFLFCLLSPHKYAYPVLSLIPGSVLVLQLLLPWLAAVLEHPAPEAEKLMKPIDRRLRTSLSLYLSAFLSSPPRMSVAYSLRICLCLRLCRSCSIAVSLSRICCCICGLLSDCLCTAVSSSYTVCISILLGLSCQPFICSLLCIDIFPRACLSHSHSLCCLPVPGQSPCKRPNSRRSALQDDLDGTTSCVHFNAVRVSVACRVTRPSRVGLRAVEGRDGGSRGLRVRWMDE